MAPRQGEYTLRESDILDTIEREGSKIALVLFPGIQYFTGQWFPMASVTRVAQAQVSCLFSIFIFPFPVIGRYTIYTPIFFAQTRTQIRVALT